MAFVGGLAGAGIGSALAMLVFAPLTAVNNFLGSYYFGSGMILGEREMYQQRWPEIKKELDKGRSFIDVLEEVMKESTQGVMNTAERTLTQVKPEWEKIVIAYLRSIPDNVIAALRGDDIQKLIEALLGIAPFQETPGETLPPPSGETSPEGISLTIEQIKSMSVNTLLFESQLSQISKYTPTTQAHMLTELEARKLSDQEEKEEEVTTQIRLTGIIAEETAYLQKLTTVLITTMWSSFIPSLPGELQTAILNQFRSSGFTAGMSRRTKSLSSDFTLKGYQTSLASSRERWQFVIAGKQKTSDIIAIQKQTYVMHALIWIHQLIYIR